MHFSSCKGATLLKNKKFLTISVFVGIIMLVIFAMATAPTSAFAQQGTKVATSAAAGDSDALVARGKYIVTIACADCHRAYNLATDKGTPLAGGNEFNIGPLGTYYSANLTKLQAWTVDDFKSVLHTGRDPKTDRQLAPVMPWGSAYRGMADDDVAAVAAYLHSLTPVNNDVPLPKPAPPINSLPKL